MGQGVAKILSHRVGHHVSGLAVRDVIAVATFGVVLLGWARERQRRRWQRIEGALEDLIASWEMLKSASGISLLWEAKQQIVFEHGDRSMRRRCTEIAEKLRSVNLPDFDCPCERRRWCKQRWDDVRDDVLSLTLSAELEERVQLKLSPKLHSAYEEWNESLARSKALLRKWKNLRQLHEEVDDYVRCWWAFAINGGRYVDGRTTAYKQARNAANELHDAITSKRAPLWKKSQLLNIGIGQSARPIDNRCACSTD